MQISSKYSSSRQASEKNWKVAVSNNFRPWDLEESVLNVFLSYDSFYVSSVFVVYIVLLRN